MSLMAELGEGPEPPKPVHDSGPASSLLPSSSASLAGVGASSAVPPPPPPHSVREKS